MITYEEVLNLNYYKKTSFTGWTEGMRFLIRREVPATDEEGAAGTAEPIFHVFAWPGPYNFETTDDSKKIESTFIFSEEGKKEAVDWLNQMLVERAELWPKHKTEYF